MKNQKGITLVALVITIIVMLILAGVTISIALNGGIISKGRKAAAVSMQARFDEALQEEAAVALANYYQDNNSNINATQLKSAMEKHDSSFGDFDYVETSDGTNEYIGILKDGVQIARLNKANNGNSPFTIQKNESGSNQVFGVDTSSDTSSN